MQRKDCNKKSSKTKTNVFHVFCDRCETHTHTETHAKNKKKINKSKRVQRPKVKIISDSDATPHEAMRNDDDDGQPSRAEPSTVDRYVCGVSVSVSVWLLGSKMY